MFTEVNMFCLHITVLTLTLNFDQLLYFASVSIQYQATGHSTNAQPKQWPADLGIP